MKHAIEPGIDILVVDDNDDIRQPLAEILRKEGYKVEEAVDGEDALNKLKDNYPCLMLLDLVMPNMDGWTLMTIMKRSPALKGITVVILSGESDAPKNADIVIRKPVDLKQLKPVLKSHCELRSSL